MDKVIEFFDALAKDDAMKERALMANEKYADIELPDEAAAAADIVAFAQAEGYSFTADDFKAYMEKTESEPREVSDEELAAVAGGAYSAKSCFCAIVGGGESITYGEKISCVCVAIGVGTLDELNKSLQCVAGGWIT